MKISIDRTETVTCTCKNCTRTRTRCRSLPFEYKHIYIYLQTYIFHTTISALIFCVLLFNFSTEVTRRHKFLVFLNINTYHLRIICVWGFEKIYLPSITLRSFSCVFNMAKRPPAMVQFTSPSENLYVSSIFL